MDFSGQVIIVAGAGGNLGAAIARLLAQRHAQLVLVDARHEPLQALAAEFGAANPPALVHGVDARTADGAQAIARAAMDRFGRIDGLANTVGTFKTADVADDAAADWSFLMDLNALSALRLTQAILPAMRAQKYGRIVHTAAGAAAKSFAGAAVYSASKAAVLRIAEAAALENRALGVTVNCVLPGTMDTPQNRAAMPNADPADWVKPEDVAAVFAFLLSREAGAVTAAGVPAGA